jgi:hypothetical protein
MKDTDLAWAAGCVDGEGCISIRQVRAANSRELQFAMYLAVGNTDPRMPLRLRELFGGNVVNKTRQQKRRPVFEWRVFSSKAGRIIAQLRPYLVIKGEQADIALAFAATLKATRGRQAEVRAERVLMKERISILKREDVS